MADDTKNQEKEALVQETKKWMEDQKIKEQIQKDPSAPDEHVRKEAQKEMEGVEVTDKDIEDMKKDKAEEAKIQAIDDAEKLKQSGVPDFASKADEFEKMSPEEQTKIMEAYEKHEKEQREIKDKEREEKLKAYEEAMGLKTKKEKDEWHKAEQKANETKYNMEQRTKFKLQESNQDKLDVTEAAKFFQEKKARQERFDKSIDGAKKEMADKYKAQEARKATLKEKRLEGLERWKEEASKKIAEKAEKEGKDGQAAQEKLEKNAQNLKAKIEHQTKTISLMEYIAKQAVLKDNQDAKRIMEADKSREGKDAMAKAARAQKIQQERAEKAKEAKAKDAPAKEPSRAEKIAAELRAKKEESRQQEAAMGR